MHWYEILGALALGIGLGLGRFRRKDKTKQPRGKVGKIAAYTLLLSGLCGVLTQIGQWSATLGSWLSVSAWLAALTVIAAAGLVVTGVVLDMQDGVPDKRTFLACIIGPQIAMVALGAMFGASVHDEMVNKVEVTKASIVSVQAR
jgi:hypothetical protein